MNIVKDLDRFMGCLVGLATGDAVGAPVEFFPRGRFPPVVDMISGGKLRIQKGEYTDDTAMALCLADSLLSRDGFDIQDQMYRYDLWARHGIYSSRTRAFGFGQTFMASWVQYRKTGNPQPGLINPKRPGNGCIMRLAPVPMYFFPDEERTVHYSGVSSTTTHGMPESIHASRLFGRILYRALAGMDKEEILFGHEEDMDAPEIIRGIARGEYRNKPEAQIEGIFYAGKCLEAALWCFLVTDTFRDAILKAANLGDDADSTAAVCGQVAGAHYGFNAIPEDWVSSLKKNDLILEFARRLYESGSAKPS